MNDDSGANKFESDLKPVSILRVFRKEDIHSVREIVDELDIASSTVHSHLKSLVEMGLTRREVRN
ncbi:helix-turn-helix domain-containing protein [Haloferax marisrubri]|uniref:helix-turn-helix domain-containing protein n=1 Tax=Haloferax marisrubri TaxID=1544719 RepID=UPI0007333D8A|nr:helix-turn-helix domain-containing protein [Haloferax marisrubri]